MKRKQHRWLLLLLAGAMSLGFAACKKASEVPLDPDHIVLDDYEIWYKGFDVTPDADGQSALVLTLDLPIMAKRQLLISGQCQKGVS